MKRPLKKATLFIDGAARGNPGPASAGLVVTDSGGRTLKEEGVFIGEATNNIAESMALILGLQLVMRMGYEEVSVFTDSELLDRQVSGRYRVKNEVLQWFHVIIRHLINGFRHFEIRHIPRGKNQRADRLAAQAVTKGMKGQSIFW